MPSPLVVDVLRDQLLQVLEWYRHPRLAFRWGVVIHQRNERGRLRFGAVTPSGESLLLSAPLLEELRALPCFLDGDVPVRLEARQLADAEAWPEPAAPLGRPRLVEAMAVYFNADAAAEETQAFKRMAGIMTPATLPSELFVLTRQRPAGWPI